MRIEQRRKGRHILMGLWLMLMLCCSPVIWASEIDMKAIAGINGQTKFNRYTPVSITIENGESDFTGRIQIVLGGSPVEYSEEVQIAAGATQTYSIPIKNRNDYYNFATVRLLDAQHNEVLKKVVYISVGSLDIDQMAIGVLSDDHSRMSYLKGINLRLDTSYTTQTIKLDASNIDEKSKNLDMLDIIVINDYNTSQLLPEQLQSIKKWVEQGGTLIVGTGVNANKTLSGLAKDVIPVSAKGTKEQTVNYLNEPITLDLAQLEIEDSALQDSNQSGNYTDLYDAFFMGSGRVIVATYDLGLEPMVSYSYNKDLWKQILSQELSGISVDDGHYSYWACGRLAEILSTYLVNSKVLIAIVAIYIVIMGIATYFILKRKQKKEYIWVVAPILSLVTTGVLYVLSMGSRLESFMVNQLDVVQVDQYQNANKISHLGVLNTQGRELVVTETDDIELSYLGDIDRTHYDEEEEKEITECIQYLGGKLQYQTKNCNVYDSHVFVTESRQVETPSYEASYLIDGQDCEVRLANQSEQEIKQLLVISNQSVWDLGTLAAGETVEQLLKRKDGKDIYEIMYNNEDEQTNWQSEVNIILEIINDVYYEKYYSKPIYLAITENQEPVLPILQAEYKSDFNYTATLGVLSLGISTEGETIYPYDYFEPYIVEQQGSGYLEEYVPVLTIGDDVELVVDYPVIADCDINWVEIGMNVDAMWNYYYSDLKGKVYLYNYKTEEYEMISVPKTGTKGYKIEKEQFATYFKDNTIRLKIEGQNEDNGLIPSIKVGGTSHATN